MSLVVSGGHTSLFLVSDPLTVELLGCTIDDAAGEAFDKVAMILGLGFPGGKVVDDLAKKGNPKAHDFPRSMLHKPTLDFSFSGLKTAGLYQVHGPGKTTGGLERLSEQDTADVAASFQAAVAETLVGKTMQAVKQTGVKNVMVGGGVAANSAVRQGLTDACAAAGVSLYLTPMKYCTDNAAMIGYLALHQLAANDLAELDLEPRATGAV